MSAMENNVRLDNLDDTAVESSAMLGDADGVTSSPGDPGKWSTGFGGDDDNLENDRNLNRQKRDSKLRYTKSWSQAWLDFCTETSFHGLKQITEPQPFILRRLWWLFLVMLGSALFLYQMITGIIYFRSHPVSVNVKINHNDSIVYPAITICNQNAFRQTVAAELGWYRLLSELFSDARLQDHNKLDVNLSAHNATDVSLFDVYRLTGHTKHDMIVDCRWNGRPCSSDDFVTTYTDCGVCYTFNSGRDGIRRQATRTGTEGGLQLLLNVEQYEYMMGPNDGAGFRVLVHTQEEFPMVKEFGVAVSPGSHSFLGMTLIRIDNLRPPHGKCADRQLKYFDKYLTTNCIQEYQQSIIQEQCMCRHIDMADHDGGMYPYCSIESHFSCVIPTLDQFNSNFSQDNCPVPCILDSYDLFNSIGEISNFDALNLLHSNLTEEFQRKYTRALEVTQRVRSQVVARDHQLVENVLASMTALEQTFQDISEGAEEITSQIDELFSQMEVRLDFHKSMGLDKVLYIMEHDFVRGWEILEERTLPYLCNNFFELIFTFRTVMSQLDETRGSSDFLLSRSQWLFVENLLLQRLDVASRARDNITEVNEKYKSGDPVITYKMTKDRRYDLSWISVDVLQKRINDLEYNQDEFYTEILEGCADVVNALNAFMEIGRNSSNSLPVDPVVLQNVPQYLRDGCVKYNYNIFRYKTRVVDGPVIVMKEQIEEFEHVNRSFYDAYANLKRSIASLLNPIEKMKVESWSTLRRALENCSLYLSDQTRTKHDLARLMVSENLTQTILSIQHVFSEMRLYGRDVNDKLLELQLTLASIWTNLLTEFSTINFYERVNKDFTAYQEQPDYYYPYFANLLATNISYVRKLRQEQLRYMMNADFPEIDLEVKLKSITDTFEKMLGQSDLAGAIGVTDVQLIDSLSLLRESLADFEKNIHINTNFYLTNFLRLDAYMQRLSYEEIIQQPAYELLNLLGDIGGSVGLFLGASAMSLAELLDVLFLQASRLIVR